MRFGHRFGLRGALLAQVDGRAHQDGHGQEFALPVLEGLEPEAAGREVLRAASPAAGRGFAVRSLYSSAAADGVQDEGGEEQQQEHDGQRVFVELEHQPPRRTGQGVAALTVASRGSWSCGASWPIGLDSEEPFWKRKTVRMTYMPICRNSDSQFSNVASTKAPVPRYSSTVTAGSPWAAWSSL